MCTKASSPPDTEHPGSRSGNVDRLGSVLISVRSVAVLSFHTSPLVQPGTGDSGGMNVYVRELVSALAQAGVPCDVYTRAWSDELPPEVAVEPGFRVVHVAAGPPAEVAKEDLPELVPAF